MQDRPTAEELLETIAGVLEVEIQPVLQGAEQHKVRVAANLCRILRRELALAPEASRRERDRLEALLPEVASGSLLELNTALAEKLLSGAGAEFEGAAWEALLATAREKLAIAKPGYGDYDFAPELAS